MISCSLALILKSHVKKRGRRNKKLVHFGLIRHKKLHRQKKGEGTKESVILLKGRQDTDQQAAKVINTLNENSFCHQESYLIISHFFHVTL